MISADRGLRGSIPSPLAPAKAAPKASVPHYGAMPPMIADSTVQDAANNTRAESVGTGRAALTDMDRGGVSRGRGNQYAAQIAEAGADAQARAGAAQQEMQANIANAAARQAYDFQMLGEQAQNRSLLENLRNAGVMGNWARRGFGQNLHEAHRRGQFGLDQMQLDYTPFLRSLLE